MDSSKPVVVVASGASLTVQDLELIKDLREQELIHTVAINDNWRHDVYWDMLYACDKNWWQQYEKVVFAKVPKERCWTVDVYGKRLGINVIDCLYHTAELLHNTANISYGSSSGFQVLQILRNLGFKQIWLLGFDCRPVGGKAHWFGQHPRQLSQHQPYERWIKEYNQLAIDLTQEHVHVVNCSGHSALTCWPHRPVRDLYERCLLLRQPPFDGTGVLG